MLQVHEELAETLVEWIEDVFGWTEAAPIGARVVTVPYPESYGFQDVIREVFVRIRDKHDVDDFWSPGLNPQSNWALPSGKAKSWPEFLWVGLTFTNAGLDLNDLRDQFSAWADDLDFLSAPVTQSWRSWAGFVSSGVSLLSLGVAGAAALPVAGPAAVIGGLAWLSDAIEEYKQKGSHAFGTLGVANDSLVSALELIGTYAQVMPVVVFMDSAQFAGEELVTYLRALCGQNRGRSILVIVAGDSPSHENDCPSFEIGFESVDPLNPQLARVEQARSLSPKEVQGQLRAWWPDLTERQIEELSVEVGGRCSVLSAMAQLGQEHSGDFDELHRLALPAMPSDPNLERLLSLLTSFGGTCTEALCEVADIAPSTVALAEHLGVITVRQDVILANNVPLGSEPLPSELAAKLLDDSIRLCAPRQALALVSSIEFPASSNVVEAVARHSFDAAFAYDLRTAGALGLFAIQSGVNNSDYSTTVARWLNDSIGAPLQTSALADRRRAAEALAYLNNPRSHLDQNRASRSFDLVRATISDIENIVGETESAMRAEFAQCLAQHQRYDEGESQAMMAGDEALAHSIDAMRLSGGGGLLHSYELAIELITRMQEGMSCSATHLASALLGASKLAKDLGQYEDSLRFGVEARDLTLDRVGSKHPDAIAVRHQAAVATGWHGDAAGAAALLEDLVSDCSDTLGVNDPSSLILRGNWAFWLARSGDLKQSYVIQKELIPTLEEVLGRRHPDTLRARQSVAQTLSDLGDYGEAMKVTSALLPEFEHTFGKKHQTTLLLISTGIGWLRQMGNGVMAHTLGKELLPDMEQTLGKTHPDTLILRQNIAMSAQYAEGKGKAHDLLTDLLPEVEAAFGIDHAVTLGLEFNLAVLAQGMEPPEDGLVALQCITPRMEGALGSEHPMVLHLKHRTAFAMALTGDVGRSVEILEEILPASKRVFGEKHPDVLNATQIIDGRKGRAGEQSK